MCFAPMEAGHVLRYRKKIILPGSELQANSKHKKVTRMELEMAKRNSRSEFETAKSEFYAMLDSLSEEGRHRQSRNPACTRP